MAKRKKPRAAKKGEPTTEPPTHAFETVGDFLTPPQEAFCHHYTHGEGTFSNGTLSYAAAYGFDLEFYETTDRWGNQVQRPVDQKQYNVCSVGASKLLRYVKIQDRIRTLLNELLRADVVDAELFKVIKQNDEKGPKVQAIREFNKLQGRIIDLSKDLSTRLPFGETDLSAIIASLPQERQDYFYGVIAELIKEAELSRSSGPAQSSGTGEA